ncbi:(d)CMP kinase [Flavobacterium sp. Sd200]|uniref:(d)CMP kinase n=1 Tax=Flavobacterium sp. Sd200 TaxID=2692211 RepID=UPI00136E5BBC|nr:(d)CMP kinase [Flavobacterium sp. Sd200]MXN91984.1 (d)CMP kinase [Flavobacterium sp. Sd200]
MNKTITIAIDGFSSTGKSTLAKQLAKKLNYIYVDTGAMYRAVTLYALRKGYISLSFFDKEALIKDLPDINLNFFFNKELSLSEMYLNQENVEGAIRKMEVSELVSQVAKVPEVREKLVEQQRFMGRDKGVVMDGRDIGTVVFPDAELKLFMTSRAETRAQRRFEELKAQGNDVTYKSVYDNIIERDSIDTGRKDSPLVKSPDAVEIDNSDLTKEEQFEKILELVNKKL